MDVLDTQLVDPLLEHLGFMFHVSNHCKFNEESPGYLRCFAVLGNLDLPFDDPDVVVNLNISHELCSSLAACGGEMY